MQTTYKLKAHEMSMTFLKSLKTLFAGQEVEITIKSIESDRAQPNQNITEMLSASRTAAPVIGADIDIRALIDESQYSGHK